MERSIRELGFASNSGKWLAILEASAQKLEAVKRALARGLGKRSQFRHLELLARPRKISGRYFTPSGHALPPLECKCSSVSI
jgi:hypothetical protein